MNYYEWSPQRENVEKKRKVLFHSNIQFIQLSNFFSNIPIILETGTVYENIDDNFYAHKRV